MAHRLTRQQAAQEATQHAAHGQRLRTAGWQFVPIDPDGNCMFAAVSYFLHNGDEGYQAQLRWDAAEYIRNNPGYFWDVLDIDPQSAQPLVEYCNRMRVPYVHSPRVGEWGDAVMLQALARMLQRPIQLYSTRGPIYDRTIDAYVAHEDAFEAVPIVLSYSEGVHYDAVRPYQALPAGPSPTASPLRSDTSSATATPRRQSPSAMSVSPAPSRDSRRNSMEDFQLPPIAMPPPPSPAPRRLRRRSSANSRPVALELLSDSAVRQAPVAFSDPRRYYEQKDNELFNAENRYTNAMYRREQELTGQHLLITAITSYTRCKMVYLVTGESQSKADLIVECKCTHNQFKCLQVKYSTASSRNVLGGLISACDTSQYDAAMLMVLIDGLARTCYPLLRAQMNEHASELTAYREHACSYEQLGAAIHDLLPRALSYNYDTHHITGDTDKQQYRSLLKAAEVLNRHVYLSAAIPFPQNVQSVRGSAVDMLYNNQRTEVKSTSAKQPKTGLFLCNMKHHVRGAKDQPYSTLDGNGYYVCVIVIDGVALDHIYVFTEDDMIAYGFIELTHQGHQIQGGLSSMDLHHPLQTQCYNRFFRYIKPPPADMLEVVCVPPPPTQSQTHQCWHCHSLLAATFNNSRAKIRKHLDSRNCTRLRELAAVRPELVQEPYVLPLYPCCILFRLNEEESAIHTSSDGGTTWRDY